MADGQRFVLEIETLIKLNTSDVLSKVRTLFNELRAEGQRAIATGSQAGIGHLPGLYGSNLGILGSLTKNLPGLSDPGRAQLEAVARRAEADYRRLQSQTGPNQNLRNLGDLSAAHQAGTKLLNEALARQSRELDKARIATEERELAERQAARALTLAAGRGYGVTGLGQPLPPKTHGPPVPPPGSRYDPIYGPPVPGAPSRLPVYGPPAPADRPVYGPPAPARGLPEHERLVFEQTKALQLKGDIAREQTTNTAFLHAKAASTVAERQRAVAIAKATREEAVAQGLGGGTFFQRLQAQLHARGGTDTRLPSDYQSFGQFLSSKALITGGFALSGAVLYGAISGFKQIVKEASALQRELAVIKPQFDALGDSQGFTRFTQRVVDIGVATGVTAAEVAHVARQLAGVFRDPTNGAADFNRALGETQQALKLSQVSGLPLQEITDSLTAITTTFGSSFTTIGDLAIGLEERFGVLAPQLITFAADVAPVAKELGFTIEQITALGAIAQQRSGVSGGALAENFNRALPSIQKAQVAIAQLLSQRESTAGFVDPVLSALGQGQGAKVIEELTKAYARMSATQRQALGDLLGGQRNAKAFFAVLQGGKDTIDALNNAQPGQFAGKLEDRFKDFQATVEFAFARAQRALEEFGLALFNSGLADGLKLIADSGADVAKVFAVILRLFSEFNDTLGGLPVKLAAVYTTLKLISLLGGGVGGLRSLVAGLALSGRGAAAAPSTGSTLGGVSYVGAASPTASATTAATTTGIKAGLAGLTARLAPAVAALAVAQLAQTIASVSADLDQARQHLSDQVADQIKSGVSPDEIIKRAQGAGAFDSATDSLQRDVELKVLTLGFADTTSPGDKIVDDIQKANAPRQLKELEIIRGFLDEKDRKGFDVLVTLFKADPANNDLNDQIARLIADRRTHGTSQEVQLLEALAAQFANDTKTAADLQTANDFRPVLDEVRARYDAGNASLDELLTADRQQLDLFRGVMANVNASADARREAAQQFAQTQKQLDTDITSAAKRVADITIRLAGLRGANVGKATLAARRQQLDAVVAQGASPDTVVDTALDVLDAQQKDLETFINSPVIQNGISRAPTSAEKLGRALKGGQVDPALRKIIVKAQLSSTAVKKALESTVGQQQTNFGIDDLLNQITQSVLDIGQGEITLIENAIDAKIFEVENTLRFAGFLFGAKGKAELNQLLKDLQTARASLDKVVIPDPTISTDTTDLANQAAIDASAEARALAEALIAKQRANARGDPVANAQSAIDAANVALQYASKPSEREAATAQLIEAQNALDDAYNEISLRLINLSSSLTSDPVAKASYELQSVQNALERARGTAAEYDALARQAEATRSLNEAIADVFRAQHELISAIADAAGDSVAVASEQLTIAQRSLQDLLARRAAGDDPGQAAIDRAKADVVKAQAGVRDTDLQKRESDIDFLLQMEQVTTQQAIAQFQALLQIPNLTAQQTRDILLKIKQLKDDLGRDLQFNLPSDIRLPTLYEARRLQPVGTPGGPSSYQDNRNIVLNLNAYNQGDLSGAVDTILGTLGSRPRNGNQPGAYP